MSIKLIVGLGNPGAEYADTRHNVGVWFIEQLAKHEGGILRSESKFHGQICKVNIDGHSIWLLRPDTYMNESGRAVSAVCRFYKIEANEILVAHDELDFPAGDIRLKENGGHGGHNGLRDIMSHVKRQDFLRLRIGIGHPGDRDKVTPYVLSNPSRSDKDKILSSIDEGLYAVPKLVSGEVQEAFRYLHSE